MRKMEKIYEKPNRIIDKKEERILKEYDEEYKKLITRSKLSENMKAFGK